MLTQYLNAALHHAKYELLPDNEGFYGEIPGFQGVWASAKTMKKCRESLREVLEDWIVLKLRSDEALPSVHGKRLTVPELTRA